MARRPTLFRQGDVLLRAIDRIPGGTTLVARESGRIVLAHGEVTGHAHAIAAPETVATLLTTDEQARFLRLVADVDLIHEEHAPIHLPAGLYEVILQREWTDEDDDRHERERWRLD